MLRPDVKRNQRQEGGNARKRFVYRLLFSFSRKGAKFAMAQKKVYAVKRGRVTGLFTSWDECRAQVEGFAGAVYKGFASPGEAQAWLFGKGEALSLFDEEPASPPARPRKKRQPSPVEQNPPGDKSVADHIVYTDGSCLRNPDGPGGYAAVIVDPKDGTTRELSGGEPSTTNNRMELRAGIEALRALPPGSSVDFYTDSQYMKNAFTNHWLRNWKRRGWITATGDPVKNQDLWRALDEAFQSHDVRFHWVKGHAGNRWNERCDKLARSEAAKFL